jgi:creatinine amidohydrolase
VHRAGLRKLIFANGHGGNVAALDLVALDLRARLGMLAVPCSFPRFGYPDGMFGTEEVAHGIHGGDVETSIMLAARPDLVRTDLAKNFVPSSLAMAREFKQLRTGDPVGFGWMSQDLNPSGAIGDATLATAAKGEAALAHGARAFVELLDDVARFDLAKLAEGPLA